MQQQWPFIEKSVFGKSVWLAWRQWTWTCVKFCIINKIIMRDYRNMKTNQNNVSLFVHCACATAKHVASDDTMSNIYESSSVPIVWLLGQVVAFHRPHAPRHCNIAWNSIWHWLKIILYITYMEFMVPFDEISRQFFHIVAEEIHETSTN